MHVCGIARCKGTCPGGQPAALLPCILVAPRSPGTGSTRRRRTHGMLVVSPSFSCTPLGPGENVKQWQRSHIGSLAPAPCKWNDKGIGLFSDGNCMQKASPGLKLLRLAVSISSRHCPVGSTGPLCCVQEDRLCWAKVSL